MRADITHAMLLDWKIQEVLYQLQNICKGGGAGNLPGKGCIWRRLC